MTTKKQKKGKTVPLADFLSNESKLVTVRATNWSEIVDNEEAETKPIVVDIGSLPTAPRAAHDIDFSTVSNDPPFVAHVANLSFEISDEHLRRIFADLNPKAARVMKDGSRSRGIGLVEFETRENLIEALKRTDKEIYGRKIRINVSDKTDVNQTDSGSRSFGNRSNRTGEERPEMADRWKRAEPRSDDMSSDRPRGGFNRDRQHRSDFGQSNMGGNSRDNQSGNDYGYGYPRSKDDRIGTGSGNRDYNRSGQRNRHQDDDNRSNSGAERPRYSGRYSDTRDTRQRPRENADEPRGDDQQEPPRERQRLQLQPRTKPLEEVQPLSGSSSSINNVAANARQSSVSNPDESSSSITNTSNQQIQDSSINESRDEYQQQISRDSTDDNSQINTGDDQSAAKPSRGAGASIFGGAKPVDTAAKELEIEKKLKELQMTANTETTGDAEETTQPSRPSYNRGGDREYRNKRSSHNDEYRDRRDEGRSGHSGDYHNKRESNDNRQFDDDNRKHNNEDNFHRRGGQDRDRYGGPPRRDQESGRTSKYNHSDRDNERGNNRHRNEDANEFNVQGRSSNKSFENDSQPSRNLQRKIRPAVQTDDNSNRLQLSNKFGMLDNDDPDDHNEKDAEDEAQSPSVDE